MNTTGVQPFAVADDSGNSGVIAYPDRSRRREFVVRPPTIML
jgi:hypothetical protein